MKKPIFLVLVCLLLAACAGSDIQNSPTVIATIVLPTQTSRPESTATPQPTATLTRIPATNTPAATATPAYPPEGRGPYHFAQGVDPLTGLEVKNPVLLDRRPIVIKVENLPREHRPQWGLTLADLVYEYYTEQGATRFAAIFYGSDAERVAPIRSGRFFDSNVVQMYKAVFVYGSAYPDVQNRFFNSDFAKRLILEIGTKSCPALCRYDPNGLNLLAANTTAMNDYLKTRKVDNTRQNQDGMFFKYEPPTGGETASQVYVRYSGAIYNRWDYDPAAGRYLRFSDKQNDINRNNEVYEQLTDRLTNQPVSAQTVVTLCVPHQYYYRSAETEVMDIIMDSRVASYTGCDGVKYNGGTGPAYVARDGKMYKLTWQRKTKDSVLTLVNADGSLFPFKPGQTWYEVIGSSSKVEQKEAGTWRFTHVMAQ